MNVKRWHTWKWLILLLAFILLAGAGASAVIGQTGGGYNLEWNVVAASGSSSSTATPPHALSGSAGQPAAGGPMTGGSYSLSSGFWARFQPLEVYIPVIKK